MLLGDLGDLADGEDCAGLVVGPHGGDEGVLRALELGAEAVEVDLAHAVHGELDLLDALGLEAAAGLEDGGVLDGRGDHLEVLAEPVGGAADGGVVGLRGARGEVDLVRPAVEERGHLLARLLHVLGDLSAEGVHRRRVAVELAEEGRHRVAHLGRDLRGGVVVEIDDLAHGV